MTDNNFHKEEEEFYEELIKLLEWTIKGPNKEIFCDFFPVTVSGRKLVKFDSTIKRIDYKEFITFRPLKNNKHCQFLVDRLFEEEEVGELLINKNHGKYGAKVTQVSTEEIMLEVDNCDTELEAKIRIVSQYFFGGKYDRMIKKIKRDDSQRMREVKKDKDKGKVKKYGKQGKK